jgi:SAM-dependent methyltransferase
MSEPVRSETTPCVLCGHQAYTPLYPTHDRLCGVPGEFRLIGCDSCGLVYLSPRPFLEDIGQYYPSGYAPFIMQRVGDMPLLLRLSVRYGLHKRCRLVRRYRAQGRLLDVGCATGQFLAEMTTYPGWEVTGVEPNDSAAEFAQRAHGLSVYQSDLISARFPDRSFDVVTLWDVIEHLHDPLAMLTEVRRILAPEGLLIMRTPSLDSWDAHAFGQYWAGLDSPRHLIIFSRRTALRILDATGFGLRRFHTGGGSYFGCRLSLRFWADSVITRPSLRRLVVASFDNPVARAVVALPLTLTDALGLGSEMVIVAQPV